MKWCSFRRDLTPSYGATIPFWATYCRTKALFFWLTGDMAWLCAIKDSQQAAALYCALSRLGRSTLPDRSTKYCSSLLDVWVVLSLRWPNFAHYWPPTYPWLTLHTSLSMYMVPLKKWWQHGPDSNLAISISLYSKPSFDEGPFFAIFYWKAVQGLKHIYVVKNTSSEIIKCLDFILWKPFLAFRGH